MVCWSCANAFVRCQRMADLSTLHALAFLAPMKRRLPTHPGRHVVGMRDLLSRWYGQAIWATKRTNKGTQCECNANAMREDEVRKLLQVRTSNDTKIQFWNRFAPSMNWWIKVMKGYPSVEFKGMLRQKSAASRWLGATTRSLPRSTQKEDVTKA